jgi:hypothetical protein
VGTYSDGNLLVVYEIRRQVLPVRRGNAQYCAEDSLADGTVADDDAFDGLHGGC